MTRLHILIAHYYVNGTMRNNICLQTSEVPDKIWAPIPTKLESKTSINQSHIEDHHSDNKGQETGNKIINAE